MMTFKSYIACLILWLPLHSAYGLDVSVMVYKKAPNDYYIQLTGIIEQGDLNKIVENLINRESFPMYFTIQSPGGDIVEAARIGTFIRESAYTISVSEDCHSACFFILVGGVSRSISKSGKIGLHRPFYKKEYFTGLSLKEAEEKYSQLEKSSRQYLQSMGVPNRIVELMFSIPSDEVHILSKNERKFLDVPAIVYSEWIKAECNSLSPEEAKDIQDINFFYIFIDDPPINISKGYFEYLKGKYFRADECEKNLQLKTRKSVLNEYARRNSQ